MKKLLLFTTVIVLLLGCSAETKVKYLGNARVQYNNEGYYELLFTLSDSNKNPVKAEATVDIKIVNDDGIEIHSSQSKITESDYAVWTSALAGEGTFACVKIDKNSITKGLSQKGNLYFTVCNENYFKFDEISVPLYGLPVEDFKISMPKLPIKLSTYSEKYSFDSSYNLIKKNELSSSVEINDISYETTNLSDSAKLTFFGKKTYGKDNYDFLSLDYRLIDSDGYVAKTGMVLLTDIQTGDKFKKDEIIYGLKPGQTYKLEVLKKKY